MRNQKEKRQYKYIVAVKTEDVREVQLFGFDKKSLALDFMKQATELGWEAIIGTKPRGVK